jgi:thiol-disulfide isomerase/thioredoxin
MSSINPSRFNVVFFFLIIAGIAGYYLVLRPQLTAPMGIRHPGVGTEIKYVSLQPMDETDPPLELPDLTGKVVLINYWATWCGPCVREFPELMKIKDKFADRPEFMFVSISCPSGGESRDELQAATEQFLETMKARLPVYFDPQQQTFNMVANTAGAKHAIPTTLVIDGQGTIRGIWQGFSAGMETEIEKLLEELLAKST